MRVAAPHILRFNAKRMGKRSHVFPITMLQHGNQQADFVLEMVYDRRLGQSACFGYLTNGKAPKTRSVNHMRRHVDDLFTAFRTF